MSNVLDRIRGGLVVSCQAYPGEPMRHPDTMRRIAQAAAAGGAVGIRAQGVEDLRAIAKHVDLPLIGLWKDGTDDVVITPTLAHATAVADAGADIVALDGTRRPRPDQRTLADTVRGIRAHKPVLIMADCSSVEDAVAAVTAGVDIVGTTLSGYTADTVRTDGPDLELVATLARTLEVPVLAEGRVHAPEQAAEAIAAGAWAVVVGTAITHPTTLTTKFAAAVQAAGRNPVTQP